MRRHIALEEVISPVVEGLGFVFVGLEYLPQSRYTLLRLIVDKPGGITIDDCERVSRQINAVLSVKAVIKEDYTLEVSSPGLDRQLFTPDQFREQLGKLISIRIVAPMEGRRNFKGTLESVLDDGVFIRVDEMNDRVKLAFTEIAEARLVPEWQESKGKKQMGRKKKGKN